MPSVASTDDKFVGLHAVFPEGNNFAAFLFTTSAGQYRIDWGDGTIDLVDSNVLDQHEYNYATISDSTLTSRGYKQVIITVTAVSGLLRTCDFQKRFVTSPTQGTAYATGFLDCILSMPNSTASQPVFFGGGTVNHRYIERFQFLSIGVCTNMVGLFSSLPMLQSVTMPSNTASVQNMINLFSGCSSLKSIPLFNTSGATNVGTMFANCTSLNTIPLFNFQNVQIMFQMFSNSGIVELPLLNTQNVTDMTSMFSGCTLLRSVPLFNTEKVTAMTSMFSSCFNLQSVPLFNTIKVTAMNNMFINCAALQNIPAFNTAAITTTAGTDFGNFTNTCLSVDRIEVSFARNVSLQNCQLSQTALVEVFNNLVDRTATTSATITITGNWGANALTAAERLIATNKNWTIVG
jgi:surface protein